MIAWHAQAAKACRQRMRQIKAWIARLLGLLLAAAECAAEPLSKPQESYISAQKPPSLAAQIFALSYYACSACLSCSTQGSCRLMKNLQCSCSPRQPCMQSDRVRDKVC